MAENDEKVATLKKTFRRTKSLAELEAIVVACYAEATETVTITSIGAEGTNSSGQLNFPKWLILKAAEEILEEPRSGRQGADVITRHRFSSPV